MNLPRIRDAIPWRIVLILALVPCLPLLAFWGWFRLEVPPLQRYYLATYWHSSEATKQPSAQTQIQWIMKTAPGRQGLWCIGSDVTEGSQNDLPLKLSPTALEQGWIGIEQTSVENVNSVELHRVLREIFFQGLSFRQFAKEPLLGGAAAWITVAYLVFMMREDLAYERRRLRRTVGEPEWGSYPGAYWPDNREGIGIRIRSRSVRSNVDKSVERMGAKLRALVSRSSLNNYPNPVDSHGGDVPASTEVQAEVSTARQLAHS